MGAPSPAGSVPASEFLGHPRGLALLFATETWERFSYFGNAALLVLYMVKYLFEPERIEGVLGLATVKEALELLFGRLDPQPLASQLFGFYTGLAYSTPILGGVLADRVLGQRRTVITGGVLMAIGHFLMTFEALFLIALALLILGIGAFKPNISTQVGLSMPPATHGAIAPTRSSTSASASGRSWPRWSAARSLSNTAGTTASPPPASACWQALRSIFAGRTHCRLTRCCPRGNPRACRSIRASAGRC